jgi:gliding motility-associated-like protein
MIDFLPDTVADVKSFNILEGSTYGHYSYAFTVAATKPQTATVTTGETTTLIHQQPIYYFIQAVDSCGKIFAGTHCQTIYLKGDIIGSNQTTLNWTPYAVDSGVVHTYDVLRSDDGGQNFVLIGSVDSNTFVYHDNLQQFATSPDSFCYRIQAHFNFSNKRFATGDHVSLSNDWCTHCYSDFFAPNTIFPKGKNNLFKPIITFPDILNYQMIIFNRYGEKIFISNDYNTGWKGTFNGNEVPQGNYTYLITFEKPDGKKFVQQGNVVVIY